MWPGALGIALMSFTETIAAGRAFAKPDEPWPRANMELLATGAANIGGALLGSMPGGGGTTQTAVNRLAGARTQVAELVTAAEMRGQTERSPFLLDRGQDRPTTSLTTLRRLHSARSACIGSTTAAFRDGTYVAMHATIRIETVATK